MIIMIKLLSDKVKLEEQHAYNFCKTINNVLNMFVKCDF